MKPFAFAVTLLTLTIAAYSQSKEVEEFYLYDAAFKPVKLAKDAVYFMRIKKIQDTIWQWDTYQFSGPLVSSEQYRDHDGQKPNGTYSYYHKNGYLDSTGKIVDGQTHGDWGFVNDTGRTVFIKKYDMGKLISVRDLIQEEKDKIARGDTLNKKTYEDEKESEFPGGQAQWQRYLIKTLRYPKRAMDMEKMGAVVVEFIVNSKGDIESTGLYRSVEYSLDEEALRILRSSPKWTPAFQNGKVVKSYKRQPIHFRLE